MVSFSVMPGRSLSSERWFADAPPVMILVSSAQAPGRVLNLECAARGQRRLRFGLIAFRLKVAQIQSAWPASGSKANNKEATEPLAVASGSKPLAIASGSVFV